MTGNDNGLTKRATGPADDGPPSFASGDLRVFVTALERLGHDRERLLSGAGLSGAVLDDPDARVPCEAFGAVLGGAMREQPIKNLGLRMAAETPIGAFPLLDYLVVTSNSVGEGIRQLAHYFRLAGAPTTVDVRDDADPVRIEVWASNNSFSVEFTTALTVLNLRKETGGKCSPEFVAFAHQPDDVAEAARILACEVRAGAPWSGLALSRDAWQLPFLRRDPVLRSLLEQQADQMVARLPVADGVVFAVRRALAKRVAGGDTRIDSVAAELVTTSRTLQRRLEAAGASYQDLLELARREAAERYLSDLSLSIAEVSYLLGYSEPSALHRAFKRWHRTTPQAFRKAQQGRKSSTGVGR